MDEVITGNDIEALRVKENDLTKVKQWSGLCKAERPLHLVLNYHSPSLCYNVLYWLAFTKDPTVRTCSCSPLSHLRSRDKRE